MKEDRNFDFNNGCDVNGKPYAKENIPEFKHGVRYWKDGKWHIEEEK